MKQLTEEQMKILAETAARAAQFQQMADQAVAEYNRLVMMAAPEGVESFDAERGVFYTNEDTPAPKARGPELVEDEEEEEDDYVPDVNNARIPE